MFNSSSKRAERKRQHNIKWAEQLKEEYKKYIGKYIMYHTKVMLFKGFGKDKELGAVVMYALIDTPKGIFHTCSLEDFDRYYGLDIYKARTKFVERTSMIEQFAYNHPETEDK